MQRLKKKKKSPEEEEEYKEEEEEKQEPGLLPMTVEALTMNTLQF